MAVRVRKSQGAGFWWRALLSSPVCCSPPDRREETQTEMVWTCLPFIRSGQNHPARHSEGGKKTRQTEKEVGKTTLGNGQALSSPSPRGQWRTEENGEQ